MALYTTLAAMTAPERLAALERARELLVAYHNAQMAGKTPAEQQVFLQTDFLPKLRRLTNITATTRRTLRLDSTKDGILPIAEM